MKIAKYLFNYKGKRTYGGNAHSKFVNTKSSSNKYLSEDGAGSSQ